MIYLPMDQVLPVPSLIGYGARVRINGRNRHDSKLQ
jgi:hypothetical protein